MSVGGLGTVPDQGVKPNSNQEGDQGESGSPDVYSAENGGDVAGGFPGYEASARSLTKEQNTAPTLANNRSEAPTAESRRRSTSAVPTTDTTHKITRVDWLSDPSMLQQALPHARIMELHYASEYYGDGAVNVSIGEVARLLLSQLAMMRKV